jgi:hypothetical protein
VEFGLFPAEPGGPAVSVPMDLHQPQAAA